MTLKYTCIVKLNGNCNFIATPKSMETPITVFIPLSARAPINAHPAIFNMQKRETAKGCKILYLLYSMLKTCHFGPLLMTLFKMCEPTSF